MAGRVRQDGAHAQSLRHTCDDERDEEHRHDPPEPAPAFVHAPQHGCERGTQMRARREHQCRDWAPPMPRRPRHGCDSAARQRGAGVAASCPRGGPGCASKFRVRDGGIGRGTPPTCARPQSSRAHSRPFHRPLPAGRRGGLSGTTERVGGEAWPHKIRGIALILFTNKTVRIAAGDPTPFQVIVS